MRKNVKFFSHVHPRRRDTFPTSSIGPHLLCGVDRQAVVEPVRCHIASSSRR
ncbi:hypothetical protein [Sporisorium scitamineum]|uniref:Uncharacterized protein n=1 Tax=Sporisorium scitamineum TaxID=49012 RepID=A0A0F7S4S4_9BASI|nr:hypothetical protein [Sporisorium scitamineum]